MASWAGCSAERPTLHPDIGIAYRAANFSKYDLKNASCASLGVCNPSGGLPNTMTLWFFPSYTGHLLSPFPFGSPVFAKFTQWDDIASATCWSLSVHVRLASRWPNT